jgi:hypothetical protein
MPRLLRFAAALRSLSFITGGFFLAGDIPRCWAQAPGETAAGPWREWKHNGTIWLLTTPDGAGLPPAAVVEGFPVLVRLHRDWFDFSAAKPGGEDVRFSTADGEALSWQIEYWDANAGEAGIWVRIPRLAGNAGTALRMYWGKADAAGESSGKAVFNESNGFLSVWHLGDEVRDETGTLTSKNEGATPARGVIGKARRLAEGQGISGGERILNYPTGSGPHTSQAWFRAEKSNGTVLGWGNEQAQGKVVMRFQSPPHVRMDCYFSGANVASSGRMALNEWVHVVHACEKGNSRIYVNGALVGTSKDEGSPLNIQSPARLWLGGWYNHYDFTGTLDEVRVSKVARSADWVRLEYENQKPLQTLVGPLVQPGDAFAVTPAQATVAEGLGVKFTAQAGGAQKLCWSVLREGVETLLAVDRLAFTFEAGRVTSDAMVTLRLKAVYPEGVKTKDISVAIKEAIAEPVFTLQAPEKWDGRAPIEVVPVVTEGGGEMITEWRVEPLAVIKEFAGNKLILKRAQNSGRLVVTATMSNGGAQVSQSVTITVTEPPQDAWVARIPAGDEKPEDGQFFARDDSGEGTLHYNGTLTEAADSVFLKLYADGKPVKTATAKPGADKSYALSVKLPPGLIHYHIEFGIGETVKHTVRDLVCGDAFLLNGQSNAVATDWGKGDFPDSSEWIRSFGSMGGNPESVRWGRAVRKAPEDKLTIGYWAFDLARALVEANRIPVCLINGAVGGTRIDQHQRDAKNPASLETTYGRLLWRVQQARLTHGIRGVLWHQGENDQGADGPGGGYGWENYRQYFIDLAAGWKQDFPNVQHYHVFQIWPKSCAMGIDGSDNRLREVQRNLPAAFSRMGIMSTLGIEPPGGCHYPPGGYAEIARLIRPLIERDHYGKKFAASITPPNLLRAWLSGDGKEEIILEFDQPVKWDDALIRQFYLDGEEGHVGGGVVAGNTLTLQLTAPSEAKTITYLDSREWSQKTLLRGENGIAALTFCEVPLASTE